MNTSDLVPPKRWWKRPPIRLSLRMLMILVLLIGGGFGWIIHRVTVQREAVKTIIAAGGKVKYDFQQNAMPFQPVANPGPRWLVDLLGVDFLAHVTSVTTGASESDDIFVQVGQLSRLERLDASSIPITDAGLSQLGGLSRLRFLTIQGASELTDAGLAHLADLRRLEVLAIWGRTSVKGPALAHLAGLHELRFLAIQSETASGLSSLARLEKLRKLTLRVAEVTDATFADLSRLGSLEELALAGEKGRGAGITDLGALAKLQELQVSGPWFTDAGLVEVSKLGPLSSFFVSDISSVTAAGLADLQGRRPALRIGVNGTGRVSKAHWIELNNAVNPLSY